MANATILLVDDNEDLLHLLTPALSTLGHFTVHTALNGLQGLEQAVQVNPDAIVIDLLMPELDGYQLVRALRGDPETATIPLIILTALAQDHNRFAGLAAGADQYLVKPVSITELLAAINTALTTSEAERALRLQTLAEKEDLDAI